MLSAISTRGITLVLSIISTRGITLVHLPSCTIFTLNLTSAGSKSFPLKERPKWNGRYFSSWSELPSPKALRELLDQGLYYLFMHVMSDILWQKY